MAERASSLKIAMFLTNCPYITGVVGTNSICALSSLSGGFRPHANPLPLGGEDEGEG